MIYINDNRHIFSNFNIVSLLFNTLFFIFVKTSIWGVYARKKRV